MVRPPTFDIHGMKKGAWSPDEDARLMAHVHLHGHRNWRLVPIHAGLARCGKSCRLRWVNYLQPSLRRGGFTVGEEELIIQLHAVLGNKWSAIAARLRGRTDHEVKNHWHAHLKKRVMPKLNGAANTKCSEPSDDEDNSQSDQSERFLSVEKPLYDKSVWAEASNQIYINQESAGFIPFPEDQAQLNNSNTLLNNGYSSDHSSGRISSTSSMESIQSLSPQTDACDVTTDDLFLWAEISGTCFDFDNNLAMFDSNIESNCFGYSSIDSWINSSFGSPVKDEYNSMGAFAGAAYDHETDDFFAKNRENIEATIDIILQQDDMGFEDIF